MSMKKSKQEKRPSSDNVCKNVKCVAIFIKWLHILHVSDNMSTVHQTQYALHAFIL